MNIRHKIYTKIFLSFIYVSAPGTTKLSFINIVFLTESRGRSHCRLLFSASEPWCVYLRAKLSGSCHTTLLAGSSVTTTVEFSRLKASDCGGRLHIDVDNKPAENYVKLATGVLFGSTHWQVKRHSFWRNNRYVLLLSLWNIYWIIIFF
jgi:hypothetical protein